MKTLVLSGFACPPQAWQDLGQVISLATLIQETENCDLRSLGKLAANKINEIRPECIVMHDFGVTIGFLALTHIFKKSDHNIKRLVFFNGAIRGFDVTKNRHPFLIQLADFDKIRTGIQRAGGECDQSFKLLFSNVKKLYRQVILLSLLQKLKGTRPLQNRILHFDGVIDCYLSPNDQFINKTTLDQLVADVKPNSVTLKNYGHFPYSMGIDALKKLILI